MTLRVNIGGINFYGHKGPFGILQDGFTGWWDSTERRTETQAIPNGHGSYALPTYAEQRIITTKGIILADTDQQLYHQISQLRGLLVDGHPGTITVERPWSIEHIPNVWLNAPVKTKQIRGPHRAEFTFELRSPDPRIFGEARVVPAAAGVAALVENRGSAPAWPKIVVSGAVSAGGYTITGPGGELYRVTSSPSSSQTHFVDMWDGMLRVNLSMAAGAGLVAEAQTFTIPPGGKVPVTLSKGGRIELYDTYM